MAKDIVDEFCQEDSVEWSFPDLELFIKTDFEALYEENTNNSDGKITLENEKEDKLDNLIKENEVLKRDYQEKIALVDTVLTKLKNPISQPDKDMMELMQNVIKMAVKKIIYKEIKSDPKLVNKIIDELTALVDSHDGMVYVMVSEIDYNRLLPDYDKSKHILKVNPMLKEGDVIIKSNFSEIQAVLNDRINQVLGIKHV